MRLVKFVPIVLFCLSFNLIATEESKVSRISFSSEKPTNDDITKLYDSQSNNDKTVIAKFEFAFAFKEKHDYDVVYNSTNPVISHLEFFGKQLLGSKEDSYEHRSAERNYLNLKVECFNILLTEVEKMYENKNVVLCPIVNDELITTDEYTYYVIVEFNIGIRRDSNKLDEVMEMEEGESDNLKKIHEKLSKLNALVFGLTRKYWDDFNYFASCPLMFKNMKKFLGFLKEFSDFVKNFYKVYYEDTDLHISDEFKRFFEKRFPFEILVDSKLRSAVRRVNHFIRNYVSNISSEQGRKRKKSCQIL